MFALFGVVCAVLVGAYVFSVWAVTFFALLLGRVHAFFAVWPGGGGGGCDIFAV